MGRLYCWCPLQASLLVEPDHRRCQSFLHRGNTALDAALVRAGTLMKLTSRSMAAGATCIGRPIATGISSTRCWARPVTWKRLGGSSARHGRLPALCRTGW